MEASKAKEDNTCAPKNIDPYTFEIPSAEYCDVNYQKTLQRFHEYKEKIVGSGAIIGRFQRSKKHIELLMEKLRKTQKYNAGLRERYMHYMSKYTPLKKENDELKIKIEKLLEENNSNKASLASTEHLNQQVLALSGEQTEEILGLKTQIKLVEDDCQVIKRKLKTSEKDKSKLIDELITLLVPSVDLAEMLKRKDMLPGTYDFHLKSWKRKLSHYRKLEKKEDVVRSPDTEFDPETSITDDEGGLLEEEIDTEKGRGYTLPVIDEQCNNSLKSTCSLIQQNGGSMNESIHKNTKEIGINTSLSMFSSDVNSLLSVTSNNNCNLKTNNTSACVLTDFSSLSEGNRVLPIDTDIYLTHTNKCQTHSVFSPVKDSSSETTPVTFSSEVSSSIFFTTDYSMNHESCLRKPDKTLANCFDEKSVDLYERGGEEEEEVEGKIEIEGEVEGEEEEGKINGHNNNLSDCDQSCNMYPTSIQEQTNSSKNYALSLKIPFKCNFGSRVTDILQQETRIPPVLSPMSPCMSVKPTKDVSIQAYPETRDVSVTSILITKDMSVGTSLRTKDVSVTAAPERHSIGTETMIMNPAEYACSQLISEIAPSNLENNSSIIQQDSSQLNESQLNESQPNEGFEDKHLKLSDKRKIIEKNVVLKQDFLNESISQEEMKPLEISCVPGPFTRYSNVLSKISAGNNVLSIHKSRSESVTDLCNENNDVLGFRGLKKRIDEANHTKYDDNLLKTLNKLVTIIGNEDVMKCVKQRRKGALKNKNKGHRRKTFEGASSHKKQTIKSTSCSPKQNNNLVETASGYFYEMEVITPSSGHDAESTSEASDSEQCHISEGKNNISDNKSSTDLAGMAERNIEPQMSLKRLSTSQEREERSNPTLRGYHRNENYETTLKYVKSSNCDSGQMDQCQEEQQKVPSSPAVSVRNCNDFKKPALIEHVPIPRLHENDDDNDDDDPKLCAVNNATLNRPEYSVLLQDLHLSSSESVTEDDSSTSIDVNKSSNKQQLNSKSKPKLVSFREIVQNESSCRSSEFIGDSGNGCETEECPESECEKGMECEDEGSLAADVEDPAVHTVHSTDKKQEKFKVVPDNSKDNIFPDKGRAEITQDENCSATISQTASNSSKECEVLECHSADVHELYNEQQYNIDTELSTNQNIQEEIVINGNSNKPEYEIVELNSDTDSENDLSKIDCSTKCFEQKIKSGVSEVLPSNENPVRIYNGTHIHLNAAQMDNIIDISFVSKTTLTESGCELRNKEGSSQPHWEGDNSWTMASKSSPPRHSSEGSNTFVNIPSNNGEHYGNGHSPEIIILDDSIMQMPPVTPKKCVDHLETNVNLECSSKMGKKIVSPTIRVKSIEGMISPHNGNKSSVTTIVSGITDDRNVKTGIDKMVHESAKQNNKKNNKAIGRKDTVTEKNQASKGFEKPKDTNVDNIINSPHCKELICTNDMNNPALIAYAGTTDDMDLCVSKCNKENQNNEPVSNCGSLTSTKGETRFHHSGNNNVNKLSQDSIGLKIPNIVDRSNEPKEDENRKNISEDKEYAITPPGRKKRIAHIPKVHSTCLKGSSKRNNAANLKHLNGTSTYSKNNEMVLDECIMEVRKNHSDNHSSNKLCYINNNKHNSEAHVRPVAICVSQQHTEFPQRRKRLLSEADGSTNVRKRPIRKCNAGSEQLNKYPSASEDPKKLLQEKRSVSSSNLLPESLLVDTCLRAKEKSNAIELAETSSLEIEVCNSDIHLPQRTESYFQDSQNDVNLDSASSSSLGMDSGSTTSLENLPVPNGGLGINLIANEVTAGTKRKIEAVEVRNSVQKRLASLKTNLISLNGNQSLNTTNVSICSPVNNNGKEGVVDVFVTNVVPKKSRSQAQSSSKKIREENILPGPSANNSIKHVISQRNKRCIIGSEGLSQIVVPNNSHVHALTSGHNVSSYLLRGSFIRKCLKIQRKGRYEHRKLSKKQSKKVQTFVKKELVEFLQQDFTNIALNAKVAKFEEECNEVDTPVIARSILNRLEKEDCTQLNNHDFPAPPLSIVEEKLLTLLITLKSRNSKFSSLVGDVLSGAEYYILNLRTSPQVQQLCKVTRFFSVLCRAEGLQERAQALCYDALYSLKRKCWPVIYTVLTYYCEALPKASSGMNSPICVSIVHSIFDSGYCSNPNGLKINGLKLLLRTVYKYEPNKVSNPDLLNKFISDLICQSPRSEEIPAALILLAKRKDRDWTLQTLIPNFLVPVIQEWRAEAVCDYVIHSVIDIMGCVLKPFSEGEDVKKVLNIFRGVMIADNEVSPDLKMRAALNLARQVSHSFSDVATFLYEWTPEFIIPEEFFVQMGDILSLKADSYWKAILRTLQHSGL